MLLSIINSYLFMIYKLLFISTTCNVKMYVEININQD